MCKIFLINVGFYTRALLPQNADHWHGVRKHRCVQHRLQPLALRTPEPVLRWTTCGRKSRTERGEEVTHPAVWLWCRGNYRHQEEIKKEPDLWLYSPVKFTCEDMAVLVDYTPPRHTRMYTHACNTFTPDREDTHQNLLIKCKERVLQSLITLAAHRTGRWHA